MIASQSLHPCVGRKVSRDLHTETSSAPPACPDFRFGLHAFIPPCDAGLSAWHTQSQAGTEGKWNWERWVHCQVPHMEMRRRKHTDVTYWPAFQFGFFKLPYFRNESKWRSDVVGCLVLLVCLFPRCPQSQQAADSWEEKDKLGREKERNIFSLLIQPEVDAWEILSNCCFIPK